MRLIYLLGLEHSGTTLLDHLLSGVPNAIGLGEVAGYFSTGHMRQYDQRFSHLDDAYLCSCGQDQSSCALWKTVAPFSGLQGDRTLVSQYTALANACSEYGGDDVIVIDSSKSIQGLENWMQVSAEIGLASSDIKVVLVSKDVRSFATSMQKKQPSSTSLLSTIRHFNYWRGANRQFLQYLSDLSHPFEISLYEALCQSPERSVRHVLGEWLQQTTPIESIGHNRAHILIGNKAFILRNRGAIHYDNAWQSDRRIKWTYRLHAGGRALNKELYRSAGVSIA